MSIFRGNILLECVLMMAGTEGNWCMANHGKLWDRKAMGTKVSDGELRETQTANYFSDIYLIDCAVLSANAQSC
ncbi:MAG: hypothetical protein HFG73_07020, partial [Hungatella sp.]|nr:hypothetical protein [Hungatella sp.]